MIGVHLHLRMHAGHAHLHLGQLGLIKALLAGHTHRHSTPLSHLLHDSLSSHELLLLRCDHALGIIHLWMVSVGTLLAGDPDAPWPCRYALDPAQQSQRQEAYQLPSGLEWIEVQRLLGAYPASYQARADLPCERRQDVAFPWDDPWPCQGDQEQYPHGGERVGPSSLMPLKFLGVAINVPV